MRVLSRVLKNGRITHYNVIQDSGNIEKLEYTKELERLCSEEKYVFDCLSDKLSEYFNKEIKLWVCLPCPFVADACDLLERAKNVLYTSRDLAIEEADISRDVYAYSVIFKPDRYTKVKDCKDMRIEQRYNRLAGFRDWKVRGNIVYYEDSPVTFLMGNYSSMKGCNSKYIKDQLDVSRKQGYVRLRIGDKVPISCFKLAKCEDISLEEVGMILGLRNSVIVRTLPLITEELLSTIKSVSHTLKPLGADLKVTIRNQEQFEVHFSKEEKDIAVLVLTKVKFEFSHYYELFDVEFDKNKANQMFRDSAEKLYSVIRKGSIRNFSFKVGTKYKKFRLLDGVLKGCE